MNKRILARLVAGAALTAFSIVGIAGPALAGTISMADCVATPGTEVKDHGAWVGCHGPGMGSSGTLIV